MSQKKYRLPDNFRDLGGLRGDAGRLVASRRLIRCADLSRMTEEDVQAMVTDYHIKNVVDLRMKKERDAAPDCLIPEIDYYVMDFFPGDIGGKATGSKKELMDMKSTDELHAKMRELYTEFIMDSYVRSQLAEFLQLLLRTEEGATLFHCTAGKDRTGITAAVTLTLLGVDGHDIMRDYLLTNEMRKPANAFLLGKLREAGKPQEVLDVVGAALCVEQSYMELVLETAEKEYGSFEKFIREGIGIHDTEVKALRELYLIKMSTK